jgi:hypothetical protein
VAKGGYKGLPIMQRASGSGVSEHQARMDATGVLVAKLIQQTNGNMEPLHDSMALMLDDPERMGSCCLTLVNFIHALVTANGKDPKGMVVLVNMLTDQLKDGRPTT